MIFCCAWIIQMSGALFHETLVEIVVVVIRSYILFYQCGWRSFFRIVFDKVIPMNSFDNCRVFIVLNLIGGIRDTLGDGKRSKPSLLKFLAACRVLLVIFVEYFLSYFEVVSQLEAIAISV